MAKKLQAVVKMQLPAAKATPGQSVGSSLGPHGINIPAFIKDFNARTVNQEGMTIPVVISIFNDKSFTFIIKTPPTPVLIKKACKIEKGSAKPNKEKVGKISKAQVQEIAQTKLVDLNAGNLDAAISMVAGTARSMGVEVVEG